MTFYAHYDKHTGAILAIGGHKLPDIFPEAAIADIDEAIALPFMNHERDMTEWFIGTNPVTGEFVLTQTMMDLVPLDAGTYMELPRGDNSAMGIRAIAILSEDAVEFSIPNQYQGKVLEKLTDSVATFTLTKRNDPSYVIATFEISIEQLMKEGCIVFDCDLELNDYSMFTTKQFFHYQFEVVSMPKTVARKVSRARYNKMVAYRKGTTSSGIVATHDVAAHQITLELIGKTKIVWPNADRCFLFITKPKDPTVVYYAIPFNVDSFWQDKRAVLELPKELNQAFGIASFPLTSDLMFNRQSDGNRKKTNN